MLEKVREWEWEGSIIIGCLGSKVRDLCMRKAARAGVGYVDLAFFLISTG